jgi:methyl-accepting chemotaxis protein
MQASITLNQLGIFIIFILILLVGGYAFVALRNLNSLITEVKATFLKNKDSINQIIPNINEMSANTAQISNDLKISAYEVGEAVRTISHETTDTVLTINETADYMAKYAVVIGEIIKTVMDLFSSGKNKSA